MSETYHKIYTCKYCNEKFDNLHKYRAHIGYKHKNTLFTCSYCGKKILGKGSFSQHLKKHLKTIEEFTPYTCEKCGKLVSENFGSGRFCSRKCANTHVKNPSFYEYICEKCNKKFIVNKKIKKDRKIHCKDCKRAVKHFKDTIKNIKELSKRTISKILKRSKMSCSLCGWNEATCDIHHIVPKKYGGSDDNSNLIIVCPNCHRIIHTHSDKITQQMLLNNSLDKVWDKLKTFYYPSN